MRPFDFETEIDDVPGDVVKVEVTNQEREEAPDFGSWQTFIISQPSQVQGGSQQVLANTKMRHRAVVIIVGFSGTLTDSMIVFGTKAQADAGVNGTGGKFPATTANGGNYSFVVEDRNDFWVSWANKPGGVATDAVWYVIVHDERYQQ